MQIKYGMGDNYGLMEFALLRRRYEAKFGKGYME
jgi:hypothetical protein